MRFFSDYMNLLPIVQPSESQRVTLEALVSDIIQAHKSPSLDAKLIAYLEQQINDIVYSMYGVNNDHDRAIIKNVVGGATVSDEKVAVGNDD